MAKNDRILLDGIIDDRVSLRLPSDKRDEAFEYLAFEQILKDYDLSSDEVLSGSVDGSRDGGIDGFFVLVNGHLLQDPESFLWPRSSTELRVLLITCKHHDTFKQATLDALIATLTEFLDFAVDDSALTGAYSEALLRMRSNLKFAYRKLSPRLSSFTVNVYYASRGDVAELGDEVAARAKQIASVVEDSFGSCQASFSFVGATEIIQLHRRMPNYTLELPFVEALAKGERYVLLARLTDYFNFVTDGGRLRRYLFESNVRDFMGLNRVNEDIRHTLKDQSSPDFWWLNNGVTILATSAAITGKSIQVSDIQIVNGLQTTESVYRHFRDNPPTGDDRCVLVKVLVTKDEAVRDAITRATNNQTDVELASLHATDKIQRDIEDVLLRHGLFYERRKNFYANQGHSPQELVTPLYAASAYIALVLKTPQRAVSLRSKFMRDPASYAGVFSESAPLAVWPKIVQILRRVDAELEFLRPRNSRSDKFLKSWRYITALALVAEQFGSFSYSIRDLLTYDLSRITQASVRSVWEVLAQVPRRESRVGGWNSHRNVVAACEALGSAKGITNVKAIASAKPPLDATIEPYDLPDSFIERVKPFAPPQPWKPGVHRSVCERLGCQPRAYFAAIDRLIEDGFFLQQRDGVLYDHDGNVVGIDVERVDPETLMLRRVQQTSSQDTA